MNTPNYIKKYHEKTPAKCRICQYHEIESPHKGSFICGGCQFQMSKQLPELNARQSAALRALLEDPKMALCVWGETLSYYDFLGRENFEIIKPYPPTFSTFTELLKMGLIEEIDHFDDGRKIYTATDPGCYAYWKSYIKWENQK